MLRIPLQNLVKIKEQIETQFASNAVFDRYSDSLASTKMHTDRRGICTLATAISMARFALQSRRPAHIVFPAIFVSPLLELTIREGGTPHHRAGHHSRTLANVEEVSKVDLAL